jgi:hypothetical protein
MRFEYKGFQIDPQPLLAAKAFIAHAAVHVGHGKRHFRQPPAPRLSGEIARFDTADEAVKCALDWAVTLIDHGNLTP